MDKEISLLDRILFRSKYKEELRKKEDRIEELEDTISGKNEQMKNLEENISEAVTEKQSAYEERNKLSDKVAQLEDKIDSQQSSDGRKSKIEDAKHITGKNNVREFVRILSSVKYQRGNAKTIGFKSGDSKISEYKRFNSEFLRRMSPVTVFEDSLGVIRVAVKTPLKTRSFEQISDSFRINRKLFEPSENLVFGIITSDIFAVGLYDGWTCDKVETVESNVKGNHSKGGFSQSRFEESRRKQINEHIEKCSTVLDEMSSDNSNTILVGSSQVVGNFEDEVNYTGTSDARGDPKSALKKAFRDFWSINIYHNF